MNRPCDKKIAVKSLFTLGLLLLTACSSSVPSSSETSNDPNAATNAQVALNGATDAVPDDHNPELELAIAAGAVIVNPNDAALDAAVLPDPSAAAPLNMAVVSNPELIMPPPAEEITAEVTAKVAEKPKIMADADVKDLAPGEGHPYTVKAGDTLMKISFEQFGDLYRWREIYNTNKARIADPNHVPPGTILYVAGAGRSPSSVVEHQGIEYLIKDGDTLGKISKTVYGSLEKWRKIWDNNKQLIRDPNKIYSGFYLYYLPEDKKVSSTQGEFSSEDFSEGV